MKRFYDFIFYLYLCASGVTFGFGLAMKHMGIVVLSIGLLIFALWMQDNAKRENQ